VSTEIWDPAETPRRLTLFDETEAAPFVLAYCEPRFWEGFYVPRMSLALLAFYWGQCWATDPNGTWRETVPRLGASWAGWEYRATMAQAQLAPSPSPNDAVVIPHHDDDPGLALIYEPVGKVDGILQYAFDRLPWRDAT
jgi:hypothetical protein